MKKTLIALAALGAMAGVAHAQSTVTLYGLIDANVGAIKTNVQAAAGAPVRSLNRTGVNDGATGGLQGSRWGMRVSEDLGGGLAAVANLESGFAVDTGASAQGGLLFGRRANVGLSGGFGTVTLGRQSSAYTDVAANHAMMGATLFDPSGTNNAVNPAATLGTSATLLNRNTTWIGYSERINNSVKYVSPVFGGFSAGLLYGFGEDKTATVDATKTISANIKYANGPLLVSAGYQDEGYARTATVEPKLKNALLNVAYDFGVAKVGFGFNRAKYEGIGVAGAAGLGIAASTTIAAQKEYSFSVAVPLGATTISAGVAQSKGDTLGKSTGYGVQALYSLSKRTTLYTGVLSTKVYERLAAITASNLAGSDIGRHQQVSVGVRHTF